MSLIITITGIIVLLVGLFLLLTECLVILTYQNIFIELIMSIWVLSPIKAVIFLALSVILSCIVLFAGLVFIAISVSLIVED